jgi:hypothetical protein
MLYTIVVDAIFFREHNDYEAVVFGGVHGDGFRCENGRLLAMRRVRVGMVLRLGIRTAPVPEMRLTEVE